MATLKMHKLKITFKLISEINRGRVEEGKGETVSECDAIQLNLACQKRINNVVSLSLSVSLLPSMQYLHLFGFMCSLYRYASGLPCVRSTNRRELGEGGGSAACLSLFAF